MCKKVETAMVRWRDNDGAIEHRLIISYHRTIVPSSSCHRTIVIALLYHRFIAVAPSLSHCRTRTIVSSPSHHRVITPSTQTRWCDGANPYPNSKEISNIPNYDVHSLDDLHSCSGNKDCKASCWSEPIAARSQEKWI